MTHEEYKTAIKKQQSLIKRLFTSRKKRSDVIDKLTKERYGGLIGRFFKPDNNFKTYAHSGYYYYITGIYASSDYILDDKVDIMIVCRYLGKTCDMHNKVTGIEFTSQTFRFSPEENIFQILEQYTVSDEEGLDYIVDLEKQLTDNFVNYR